MKDRKWLERIILIFGICLSVFHIVCTIKGGQDPLKYRYTHLAFFTMLGALILLKKDLEKKKIINYIVDGFVFVGAIIVYAYFLINYSRIYSFIMFLDKPTNMDVAMDCLLLAVILIAAWRHIGWLLPVVALIFLAYGAFGSYLPGALKHSGVTTQNMLAYLTMTTNGVFGSAINTSSPIVIFPTITELVPTHTLFPIVGIPFLSPLFVFPMVTPVATFTFFPITTSELIIILPV